MNSPAASTIRNIVERIDAQARKMPLRLGSLLSRSLAGGSWDIAGVPQKAALAFADVCSSPRRLWDLARETLRGPDGRHDPYAAWRLWNDRTPADRDRLRAQMGALDHRPLFSIVMPVYAPDRTALERCLASVRAQVYPHWQLCIADDASPQPWVRTFLEELVGGDPRIRVRFRDSNGHISRASNSALALAEGEFVALLDQDDELSPDALYEVAAQLNREPDLDVVYSDEDKLDEQGRRFDARFKPDWSPELLLSQMYLGHLGVYRRDLVEAVGGFREGYEGSQDHDLALRVTERARRVRRIPRVLYHWRVSATSAAGGQGAKPYAVDAARRALEDALVRRGKNGRVEPLAGYPGHAVVHYRADLTQRVSIVIPSPNGGRHLDRCLSSIVEKTRHANWDVCVVDDGSRGAATQAVFARWRRRLGPERFQVLRRDDPSSFARRVNAGVSVTSGPLILLLDANTEVVESSWLEKLAGYAQQPELGAIGARLLYPGGQLQHGGIALDPERTVVHVQQFLEHGGPGYFGQFVAQANFTAVTGACLMVRRDAFERVGGFDESLESACSDVDFCLKLRALGLRNVVLGHVQLIHDASSSRGPEREAILLKKRWPACFQDADPHVNPNLDPLDFSPRLPRTAANQASQPAGPAARARHA